MVNASASQLTAYLEQLPEATRRRLTGGVDRVSGTGGFHLLTASSVEKDAGGGQLVIQK